MIALDNVTIIIPFRGGNEERISALYSTINYLNSIFVTKIIVAEEDSISRISLKEFCNITHFFIKSDSKIFNRTAVINYLINKVETPIFINHDADVILDRKFYLKGIELILDGYDMVIPHNGTVWSVMHDFKFNGEIKKTERKKLTTAVGGIVIHNKNSYVRIGMENERIIGWGYEDFERLIRSLKLGQKVYWSPYDKNKISFVLFGAKKNDLFNSSFINTKIFNFSYIYHFKHGQDDINNCKNPYLSNNKNEYLKVRKMKTEDLIKYIETWNVEKDKSLDISTGHNLISANPYENNIYCS
jgi:hypothetical protein